MSEPKCFISYSWDSDEHKKWVRNLATKLTENGVLVYLDQWDVRPGLDLPQYMETAVRNSDFVLLVCNPIFASKANLSKGGVGYEKSIVTGEIFNETSPDTKFVPILREGTKGDSLPSYLQSKAFVDFRNNEKFPENFEELLRHIYDEPTFKRPSLGERPSFDKTVQLKKRKVKPSAEGQKSIFSLDKYKEFFEFAEGYDQMALSKAEAREWADKWSGVMTDEEFILFKATFKFAFDYDGLSLSKQAAISWTENIVRKLSENKINDLIRSFRFASDYSGLGLSIPDAHTWALEKLNLPKDKFPADF